MNDDPDLADRIEECAAMLMAAALQAGMAISGDSRVSEVDAAQLLGLAGGTLRNLRGQGCGPQAFRIPLAGCSWSYRLDTLAQWIEAGRGCSE